MPRAIKITLIALLVLTPICWFVAKLTLLNPAWIIQAKYPDATIEIYAINSPDPHFWSSVAGILGVRMADSDHALSVSISGDRNGIRLDDFVGATEATFTDCHIHDISAYWQPGVRLYNAAFLNCDFSDLPIEQREILVSSDTVPGLYAVPYSAKDQTNKAEMATPRKPSD